MTLAKNNPIDLMRNDPDFRAAMWNTAGRVLVKQGRSIRLRDGVLPFWTALYTVDAWSIVDDTLVIELRGSADYG